MEANAKCAHCGSPIVDRSTVVERGDQTFCCRNCEAAMSPRTPGQNPDYTKEVE
jgi:hypothetical protein